ncbi:MAG: VWA domain-containing protein [Capsulimonas sp.]|uniref:VWA domain-containing protein n=1 Tax=Capsulimonas sp. TaxID=2494211 RepID=UPI003263EDA0
MNNPWRRYAVFIGVSVLAHVLVLGVLAWWLTRTPSTAAPSRKPVEVQIVERPRPAPPKPKPTRIAALPTPPTPHAVPSPTPTPKVTHPTPRPKPAVQHITKIFEHLPPHPTRGGHSGGAAPARKAPVIRKVQGKPRPHVLTTPAPSPQTTPQSGSTEGHDNVAASPTPSPENGSGDQAHGVGDGAGKGEGTGQGKDSGSGDVGTDDGPPTGPFGVPGGGGGSGPRHIVYVLDVSGSMTSRIDKVQEELNTAIAGLRPGESFDVLAFSDSVEKFHDGLLDATPANIARARNFVGGLTPLRGTNVQDAMRAALAMPDVNVVFLISDGVPSVKETNTGKLRRDIQKRNKNGARIFTVGLAGYNPGKGGVSDFEAADLLRHIAEDSGGTYKTVTLGY